jgi:hypothetical protein
MKTIAQQLNVKEFPFEIRDKNRNLLYWENESGNWSRKEYDSNGNIIYYENSTGYWYKQEFDSNGNQTYYKNSNGLIEGNRPKSCDGKVVEIDGKKYKLKKI